MVGVADGTGTGERGEGIDQKPSSLKQKTSSMNKIYINVFFKKRKAPQKIKKPDPPNHPCGSQSP